MKNILPASTFLEAGEMLSNARSSSLQWGMQKTSLFSKKGFDFCWGLLYNLATPRYNKVFFPKLYSAGNGYSKG